jgi:hypothetical protein
MSLIGSTFDDGEPYTQSLLAQLTSSEIWRAATKSNSSQYLDVPRPITYSDQELAKQEEELANWGKDIERKARGSSRSRRIHRVGWRSFVGGLRYIRREVGECQGKFSGCRIEDSRGEREVGKRLTIQR